MDLLFKDEKSDLKSAVKGPSMMVMGCNLVEVIRLREEIIQRVYETDVLSVIYKR